MEEEAINPLRSHYLKVQALSPVKETGQQQIQTEAVEPAIMSLFSKPLPLSIMLFLVLTGAGLLALVITKAKDINKVLTLLFLALITSAIPYGLQLAGEQTRLQSKAGPTVVPKNLTVAGVRPTGFTVSWETDEETVGTIRLRPTEAENLRQQLWSEPEESKVYKHVIEVKNLEPGQDYYFEVLSGATWYNLNGKPIKVRTPDN